VATFFLALVLLTLQTALFVAGGVTIFNMRLTSAFALVNGNEARLNLQKTDYDNRYIEFQNGRLSLKPIADAGNSPINDSFSPADATDTPTEISPKNEPSVQPSSEPSTELRRQPVSASTVLGLSNNSTNNSTDNSNDALEKPIIRYKSGRHNVRFQEAIDYDDLLSLSARFTPSLDTAKITSQPESWPEDLAAPLSKVTFQLSVDGTNYYYYGSEGWEKTTVTSSSNSLEFINTKIDSYVEKVGGNKLFVQAILQSDGQQDVELESVTVNRELNLISAVNSTTSPDESKSDLISEKLTMPGLESFPVSSPISTEKPGEIAAAELPVPTIFSASYANGSKIIYGKILAAEGRSLDIPQELLAQLSVKAYYTDSTDLSKSAAKRGEYIGSAPLVQNDQVGHTFTIIVPNRPGGFVTTQLVYAPGELVINSILSKPVRNSTFIVDSAADQTDISPGNGLCQTAVFTCTYKAALSESNDLAGYDYIHFNIPTSDPGYRDYDSPDSPNSGDSSGGDDYWTIRPVWTGLQGRVASNITIDGSTQELLSGVNRNISGPDIEISTRTPNQRTISISGSSTNYLINGLVLQSAYRSLEVNTGTTNVTVTNNYIGVDVKGQTSNHGTMPTPSYNLYLVTGGAHFNINIGTNINNGNVIGGPGFVYTRCNNGSQFKFKGNKFNQTADGLGIIQPASEQPIYIEESCDAEFGGSTPNEGNYFGRTLLFVYVSNASNPQVLNFQNNYVGMDISGNPLTAGYNRLRVVRTANFGQIDNVTISDNTIKGNTTTAAIASNNGAVIQRNNMCEHIVGAANGLGISIETPLASSALTSYLIEDNQICDYSTGIVSDNSLTSLNRQNVVIRNNEVRLNRSHGIMVGASNHLAEDQFTIVNNIINQNLGDGVLITSGKNHIVRGNELKNNGLNAVSLSGTKEVGLSRVTANVTSIVSSAIVGGSAVLTGSKCFGLEKNCISNNGLRGILALDNIAQNEASLYSDNDFTDGNGPGSVFNIEQAWLGTFEVFSGDYRRTDFLPNTLTLSLPVNSYIRNTESDSIKLSELAGGNRLVSCNTAIDCPNSGHTEGVSGQGQFFNRGNAILFGAGSFYVVAEYIIDNIGNKTTFPALRFDTEQLSSKSFSFDGNSTTHPVNTSTSRLIGAQTYQDRGEPWTDNVTANRDINSANWGRFQSMEIDYVDANPILQLDGSYTITVNTTADELPVSATYIDDGFGIASGGIASNGSVNLANGQSTLREALRVADSFPQSVSILFNIPKSDPGYRDYNSPDTPASGDSADGDDYWTFRPLAQLNNINIITGSKKVIIDATTQTSNLGDTNLQGPELEISGKDTAMPTGLTINKSNSLINSSADLSTIKGLNINSFQSQQLQVAGVIAQDNFVCTDIRGLATTNFSNQPLGINTDYWLYLDNNLIGNCAIGVSGNLNYAKITRNKIGISQNGEIALPINTAILSNQVQNDSVLGGDLVDRNYFRGEINCVNLTDGAQAGVAGFTARYNNNSCGLTATETVRLNSGPSQIAFTGASTEIKNNISSTKMIVKANIISGNIIGTNTSKTLNLGDLSQDGLVAQSLSSILQDNTVFNMRYGISNWDPNNPPPADVSNNLLRGNIVGLKYAWNIVGLSQPSVISNNQFSNNELGIELNGSAGANYTIRDNDFSGNKVSAIKIIGAGSRANIRNNKISTPLNSKAAIDLSGGNEDSNLINANDPGDNDSGANSLQNRPVVSSYEYLGADQHRLQGTLANSLANENPFSIEVCDANVNNNVKGSCLQTIVIVTGQGSNWQVQFSRQLGQLKALSFLATNILGATSEFSETYYPKLPVTNTPDTYPVLDLSGQIVASSSTVLTSAPVSPLTNSISGIIQPPLNPALSLVTPLIISTLASIFSGTALYSQIGILLGFALPRKRKKFGVVIDIQANRPVPFAVVRLYQQTKVLSQVVTDILGRYVLQVPKSGSYTVVVEAPGYKKRVQFLTFLLDYQQVTLDMELIKADDKLSFLNRVKYYSKNEVTKIARLALIILVFIGTFYTFYVTLNFPTVLNLVVLIVNLLIIVVNVIPLAVELFAANCVVRDSNTGSALGGAVIRVYDINDRQITVGISDNKGKTNLDIRRSGTYKLLVSKAGYEQVQDQAFYLRIGGRLTHDLQLQPLVTTAAGTFGQDIPLSKFALDGQ